jgi:hypothetical protein
MVPTDCDIEIVCDNKFYSIDTLLDLDSSSFHKLTENMAHFLRITAKTVEVRLEYISWPASGPKNHHMSDGVHVILPGFGSYEACIAPFWDSNSLDLTKHKSVFCAILMHDVVEGSLDWPIVIILISHGSHYERIGSFMPKWKKYDRPENIILRAEHGRWYRASLWASSYDDWQLEWMRGAETRTFLLG